jgi:hypothetical protein
VSNETAGTGGETCGGIDGRIDGERTTSLVARVALASLAFGRFDRPRRPFLLIVRSS